jgi:hypothetical protein
VIAIHSDITLMCKAKAALRKFKKYRDEELNI